MLVGLKIIQINEHICSINMYSIFQNIIQSRTLLPLYIFIIM